ncbi:MAG: ligand-gated ion channel [Planctomycetota bacterium]
MKRVLSIVMVVGLAAIACGSTARGEDLLRPPSSDGPVVARLNLQFVDITHIDELTNTCTVEVIATAIWLDPRMAFDPAREGRPIRVFQDDAATTFRAETWYPQVFPINNVGALEIIRDQIVVDPTGRVTYMARVNTTLKTMFDFRRFPFDQQTLAIPLQAFAWDANEVELVMESGDVSFRSDFHMPEWELGATRVRVEQRREARSATPFSTAVIELDLRRQNRFYIWKVMLPVVTIVAISWVVFWMSDERLARRAGVSSTCILTIVAYQFLISESLPRVAYLTVLDKILLLSFVLVAVSMVLNVMAASSCEADIQRARRIDGLCKWVFPVVYLIGFVAILVAGTGTEA